MECKRRVKKYSGYELEGHEEERCKRNVMDRCFCCGEIGNRKIECDFRNNRCVCGVVGHTSTTCRRRGKKGGTGEEKQDVEESTNSEKTVGDDICVEENNVQKIVSNSMINELVRNFVSETLEAYAETLLEYGVVDESNVKALYFAANGSNEYVEDNVNILKWVQMKVKLERGD